MTVTGIVRRAAVEGSCLVLAASGGSGAAGLTYLLLGDSATLDGLASGATVTVSGRPETGLATTCQTGTPFLVDQVLRSSGSTT